MLGKSITKSNLLERMILCQEVTVQVLEARDQVQDVVWDEVEARAKAGWMGRLLQGRADIVCVRNAAPRLLILQANPVMQ